jgi:hypothetical protein
VVVAATSLVPARLIAASQGLGRASKFVEGHPIDDGFTVYPQLSHRQRTFPGYASEVPERRRVVLNYASRGLVSDEPTQISACAVGKQS